MMNESAGFHDSGAPFCFVKMDLCFHLSFLMEYLMALEQIFLFLFWAFA